MSAGLRAGTNNDGYLQVNGTDVLTALSSGRIGIGTDNPARKLEIFDTAATVLQLNSTNTGGTSLRIQNSGTDKMYMGLAGDFITGQGSNVTDSAIRASGSLLFASGGGTERLRITSGGNVGIGNDNPQSKLQIENAGEQLRLTYPSIASYIHEVKSNGDYAIDKDGTERLRITSGGNLLVGMDTVYNMNATAQIRNGINIVAEDENGDVTQVSLAGEVVGRILFGDTRPGTYGEINCIADGVCGTNDYPGRLVFRTTSDGSNNTTERLRIDSSGRLLKSGQAALTSTSLNHSIQVAAASDANAIAIIGRASDDIGELSFYEADKSTKLGEVQYRQDHANIRHRVGDIRFATGGTTERLRITSGGQVLINQTTVGAKSAAAPLQLISSASGAFGLNISMRSNNDYGFISYTDNDASEDLVQLGVQRTAADTGDLLIYTNAGNTSGTERLRIKSTGTVQINQPTYNSDAQLQLDAKDNTAYAPPAVYPANQIELQNSVSMGSALMRFRSQSNNASAGIWNVGAVPRTSSLISDFIFQSRTADSTYSEIARFSGNGGILFHGDTAQANALDDYEEGTWTISDAEGSNPVTSNAAWYVKIGSLVHIRGSVTIGSTSSTSRISLTLPFNSNNSAYYAGEGYVGYTNYGGDAPRPAIENGGIRIYFYSSQTNSVLLKWNNVSGSRIDFSATYQRT